MSTLEIGAQKRLFAMTAEALSGFQYFAAMQGVQAGLAALGSRSGLESIHVGCGYGNDQSMAVAGGIRCAYGIDCDPYAIGMRNFFWDEPLPCLLGHMEATSLLAGYAKEQLEEACLEIYAQRRFIRSAESGFSIAHQMPAIKLEMRPDNVAEILDAVGGPKDLLVTSLVLEHCIHDERAFLALLDAASALVRPDGILAITLSGNAFEYDDQQTERGAIAASQNMTELFQISCRWLVAAIHGEHEAQFITIGRKDVAIRESTLRKGLPSLTCLRLHNELCPYARPFALLLRGVLFHIAYSWSEDPEEAWDLVEGALEYAQSMAGNGVLEVEPERPVHTVVYRRH